MVVVSTVIDLLPPPARPDGCFPCPMCCLCLELFVDDDVVALLLVIAVELVAMADNDANVASIKFLFSIGVVVSFLIGNVGTTGVCVKDNRLQRQCRKIEETNK